jgi:hypothetical protein
MSARIEVDVTAALLLNLIYFVAVHESACDAVDGSSTGTRVPKMGALF